MPAYRELEPGLFELETPGGPLAVTATEDELRANGHFPESLSLSKAGAVAGPGAGGFDNSAGLSALQGGGAQFVDPSAPPPPGPKKSAAENFRSASAAVAPFPGLGSALGLSDPSVPMHGEAEAQPKTLRGGGEVKRIGGGGGGAPARPMVGGGGGGPGRSGGRDVRVSYSVQKSGLRPEDIEAAELAEADASIERKMGAQNIADRQFTRTEALSAELGRQIKAEGVALRQQEERNRARLEDFESRQRAIEAERDEVAKLNVNPADLVGEGGVTGVVAALTILAGGFGAAYNGGRNPAMEAIQGNLDRKLAQAKQKVSGKESDFDRLVKIYGSPFEAEAEFRDRQRMLVQQLGQKMALDAGATDAADNLRIQFAAWDDERAQSRLQRQEALAGRVTEQWAYQPFGGGPGKPKDLESDVQKLAKAREEAGIGEQEGEAGEVADLISELPEGELPTPGSRNVVSRAARSVVDFVGGEGSAASTFDSDAERAGAAKFSRKMNAIKSKLLGAARSPAEIQDFNEGFANVRTKEGMQQFAADWQRKIDRREAGVKAGFRPEVVETFEERQRSRQPSRRPSGLRGE